MARGAQPGECPTPHLSDELVPNSSVQLVDDLLHGYFCRAWGGQQAQQHQQGALGAAHHLRTLKPGVPSLPSCVLLASAGAACPLALK